MVWNSAGHQLGTSLISIDYMNVPQISVPPDLRDRDMDLEMLLLMGVVR